MNLNLIKSFHFSDKFKRNSTHSLFKIKLPKKCNQINSRQSNENIGSLSTLGQTARVNQSPVTRYNSYSSVHKSDS